MALSSQAHADPCTARVTGYKPGATVAGQTRHMIDGDGFCIGPGPDPATWTEIRLANFYAPESSGPGGKEAKVALECIVGGHRVECTAARGQGGRTYSYDRLIARCAVDGRDVGDAMRAAGIREGGNGKH